MLQINFYPEGNKKEFIKAKKEYQGIWEKDGMKIIVAFEKNSRLKFKKSLIKAVVFEGISQSRPLKLKSSWDYEMKKAALTHELAHIILGDNNIKIPDKDKENFQENLHKVIYLFLYDSWFDSFGENFAKIAKDKECGNPVYKRAWDWALSFPKEERAIKFKEMKDKYQKN